MEKQQALASISNSIVEDKHWLVKFAESADELETVYKLRYEVFNIELNEGLDSSFISGQDRDSYDEQFLHLIVIDKSLNKIIATYRVQTYEMAQAGAGFYSASRFDFSEFPLDIQKQGLEVSRACIAKPYRNSRTFFLLWKGIANLLYEHRLRYFFGCSSIPSRNPQDANGIVKLLQAMLAYHNKIYVKPQPGFECDYVDEEVDISKVTLPTLFNLYLRFKSCVCSEPCKDDEFKTITFLTINDTKLASDSHHKMFLGNNKRRLF